MSRTRTRAPRKWLAQPGDLILVSGEYNYEEEFFKGFSPPVVALVVDVVEDDDPGYFPDTYYVILIPDGRLTGTTDVMIVRTLQDAPRATEDESGV